MTDAETATFAKVDEYVKKFEDAMEDDFNTADAISAVFELVKFINSNASTDSSYAFVKALDDKLLTLTDVLGLDIEVKEEALDADIEALIQERTDAKKAKDFAKADAIRAKLLDMGIVLEDTREGVKWKRG
jgi:cysteinyl-tRNA synthetase